VNEKIDELISKMTMRGFERMDMIAPEITKAYKIGLKEQEQKIPDPEYSVPLDWIENKVRELSEASDTITDPRVPFTGADKHLVKVWPDSDVVRKALKDAFLYGRESRPNYDAAVAQVRQETLEAEIEHLKKVIYDKSERIKALEKGLFVHPLED